ETPAAHHKPARARMAKVMETEVVDLRLPTRALEGPADVPPRGNVASAEHEVLYLRPRQRRKRIVYGPVHRNLPSATALRLLEAQHAAGEVDTLPGEAKDLVLAHSGVERSARRAWCGVGGRRDPNAALGQVRRGLRAGVAAHPSSAKCST